MVIPSRRASLVRFAIFHLSTAFVAVLFLVVPQVSRADAFRVRLLSAPTTLDWGAAFTAAERPILQNIMLGLFSLDSNLKLTPELAASWSVSPDHLTYTFKLRKDVKWSDGRPLEARDFLFSWKRLLDPKRAAAFSYLLFPVEGARSYQQGLFNDFAKVGITVSDPHTLSVRLSRAVPGFPSMLSSWATFPLRQDLLTKYGDQWSRPDHIQVLGPYIPVEFKPDERVLLKRNERYFGAKPAISSIVFRVVASDATAQRLFDAHELEYVRLSPSVVSSVDSSRALHSSLALRSCFLTLNPSRLKSVESRRAVSLSVDRDQLVAGLGNRISAARSLVPDLIAPAAGATVESWHAPFGQLRDLKVLVQADEVQLAVGQIIQQQFKRKLGVNVVLAAQELKSYIEALKKGDWDVVLRCWNPDFPDAESYLNVFRSDSPNRFLDWHSARFEDLIGKADKSVSLRGRSTFFLKALNVLQQEQYVVVPLYFEKHIYLLSPRVRGFALDPTGGVRFKDLEWAD